MHTHFDAQVFWDGALTPSPLHGVTTALAGNCGFTIAPLSKNPADGDYLMRMLARVEGMPLESLRSGVPWNWTSTAEYFDEIDGRLGINAAFMVGHSAIRRVVMGEECVGRPATPDEIAAMQALLRAGFEAGGLGFSSSWARTHNDAEGNMVPSRYATHDEIVALASVAGEFEGTSLEFIPQVGPAFDDWAVELMADMSAGAQRALNWNIMSVGAGNLDECYGKLAASDRARSKGGKVIALTIPMSFPVRLSFRSGFVLDAMPGWESVMLLPLDEKLAYFRDAGNRARLNELAQGDDNPLKGLAHWESMVIYDVVAPENEQFRGRQVGEIAEDQGRDSWDVLTDIAMADELNTSFGTVQRVETDDDWKARVEIWRDGRAVIGASDAGAHLDLLASFNYATVLLDQAVRERGLLATRGGGAPHHRRPGAPLRPARSRPGRGWRARRCRRARSRHGGQRPGPDADGPPRRRRPAVRGRAGHRARAGERSCDRPRPRAHRRARGHPAADADRDTEAPRRCILRRSEP